MFVDASAALAILLTEKDFEAYEDAIDKADKLLYSPMSAWEIYVGLLQKKKIDVEDAQEMVIEFHKRMRLVPVTQDIMFEDMTAFQLYGKGRHKAKLNFGDCFAYACAKRHRVPLLFKGNDFVHTDIDKVI